MTASDTQTEIWKPVPGASSYEASDHGGRIRSVPRTINGRDYEGRLLTPKRTGTSRYWQVKLTYDDGKQRTRPVHALVLEAHVGLPEPGQEACHAHDDPDINDLAELRWDWPPGNRADRARNHPPQPRPMAVRECVRCGGGFTGNGRRCHACVVWLGEHTALLLVAGEDLEAIAQELEYPSAAGLHKLAVRYGGLQHSIGTADHTESWLRSVTRRWVAWLSSGDAP